MSRSEHGSVSSEKKVPIAPNEDWPSRALEFLRKIPAAGIVLSAFSGFCLAAASLIVKKTPNVNSVQILVSRSVVQIVFYLPLVFYYKLPMLGIVGERGPLFFRGFIGFIYAGLMYTAYRLIPLVDASAIIYSAPIYTTIIACIFLKEDCGVFQITAVLVTISGVIFVSRPTFIFPAETLILGNISDSAISTSSFVDPSEDIKNRVTGCVISLIAAVGSAVVVIMIRKMPQTPSAVVINAYSMITVIAGIIFNTIVDKFFLYSFFAPGIGVPSDPTDYLWLFANGMCGVFSQLTLTVALKIEEAGIVSLARTFEIVSAFIFQAAFLKSESIVWTSYLGAILIILAVTLIATKKVIDSRRSKGVK